MFTACQNYLMATLKAAGVKTSIITSEKKLKMCQDSHFGAVINDEEVFIRDGSKRRFRDKGNKRKKRIRVFERSLVFDVLIGEYSTESADAIFNKFLEEIGAGIDINGNFTYVDVDGAEWVSADDSLLKAKVTVHTKIRFRGGVYKDIDMLDLSNKTPNIRVEHEKNTGRSK